MNAGIDIPHHEQLDCWRNPPSPALGCFLWGMVSVLFSPCHLASIPLIIAYVGGQQQILGSRQAAHYSMAFTLGLFITIALIGIVCAILGRMLGDVGNYWQILVGLVLIWVALGMFGVEKCSMSGSLLYRLNLKGHSLEPLVSAWLTAFFPAPAPLALSLPSWQSSRFSRKSPRVILLILLFAIGHCLPIVVAGSSAAFVKGSHGKQPMAGSRTQWFRKGAAVVIWISPFTSSPIHFLSA